MIQLMFTETTGRGHIKKLCSITNQRNTAPVLYRRNLQPSSKTRLINHSNSDPNTPVLENQVTSLLAQL